MKAYRILHALTILILVCSCLASAVGKTISPGLQKSSTQETKTAKQSENERKQQEKKAEKQRKEEEKERKRLEPMVGYDKFSDVTTVGSQPISVTNEVFGAPQKTLFGSLPSVTSFRVVALVSYKGQQTTSASSVTLAFNAQSHSLWFISDRDLIFIADGNRLNLGTTDYKQGVAATGSTNELMQIEIPVQTFAQIVQANTVAFRLGSQSFEMNDRAAFRRVLPELPAQGLNNNQTSTEPLGLTLAGYNAIQTGMTYEDVVRILGSSGVATFRYGSGSFLKVSYVWKPQQPSASVVFLQAMFSNNKLESKGQMGLK